MHVYLILRLNKMTKGASLKSNLALIEHNAKVGCDIAIELAKISSETYTPPIYGKQKKDGADQ